MTTFEAGQTQVPHDQNSQSTAPGEKHVFTRRQRIVASIAGGAVLGGGALFGIYKGAESGTQRAIENMADNPSTSAPVLPVQEIATQSPEYPRLDPAITSPDVFKDQPYEMILSETVPFLEERREESLQKIDEYFHSLGEGSIPKRDEIIFNSEENMRAQDIERQIAADTYTITEVALTQPILAQNLARAVFKNPTSYGVFVDKDLDGAKHATNIQAFAVSPELTQGAFGTHIIDGPSLVILSGNMLLPPKPDGSHPLMNRVVTRYTYDDNKTHYSLVYQITEDNPNFVEYPENIAPTTK